MSNWDNVPGVMQPCACGCGGEVRSPDRRGRPRRWIRGHHTNRAAQAEAARRTWSGRQHSPEAKKKISAAASRPKPWIRGERNGMAGRRGADNPNYKGGSTPERQRLYARHEFRELLRSVRKRDGLRCTKCGAFGVLHVHHIKPFAEYPELRLDIDNLITLCRDCHHEEHRRAA